MPSTTDPRSRRGRLRRLRWRGFALGLGLGLGLGVGLGAAVLVAASLAVAGSPLSGEPTLTSKNKTINGTLTVAGQADATQLTVQAASGQSVNTDWLVVENASGLDSFIVDGNSTVFGATTDGLAAVTTILEPTGSQLIDAGTFPSTLSDPFGGAMPLRIQVTSGTASTSGATCQMTQTGGVSSQSCWTATHASASNLGAAGTRSGFRARPRGATGDNATAINAGFYAQAPFALSGGRDAILASDATTYEYAVLTASGSVTSYDATLTLSTLNDNGGVANDITLAPGAGTSGGAGGNINLTPSAGDSPGAGGRVVVSPPADGYLFVDADTIASTSTLGPVVIDVETATENVEGLTIRVRATADVDRIGALSLYHNAAPTALTGSNSRYLARVSQTCNASDASGTVCAGFLADAVVAGGGQEAAFWVSGANWEYGYLSNANAGHMGSTGSAPTVTSCGTNSIAGNDVAGKITITAGNPTACTVTFSTAYRSAPACNITHDSTNNITASTTTSVLTVLSPTDLTGVFMYICHEGS